MLNKYFIFYPCKNWDTCFSCFRKMARPADININTCTTGLWVVPQKQKTRKRIMLMLCEHTSCMPGIFLLSHDSSLRQPLLFSVWREGNETHKELKPVGTDSDLIMKSMMFLLHLPPAKLTGKVLSSCSVNQRKVMNSCSAGTEEIL